MNDQQLARAVRMMEVLDEAHQKFGSSTASNGGHKAAVGRFSAKDGKFGATAFGIEFEVVQRLVARDAEPFAMEYSFVAQHDGKSLCLLTVYLDTGETLWFDAAMTIRIHDAGNPRASRVILDALAVATLKSELLAPRSTGQGRSGIFS